MSKRIIYKFFLILGWIGVFYLSENVVESSKNQTAEMVLPSEIQPNNDNILSFDSFDHLNIATLPQTISCTSSLVVKINFGNYWSFACSVVSKYFSQKICEYTKTQPYLSSSLIDCFIDFHNFRS